MKWSDALSGVCYEYQGEGIPSNWYSSKENGVYKSVNVGDISSNNFIDMSKIKVKCNIDVAGINFTSVKDGFIREHNTNKYKTIVDLSEANVGGRTFINVIVDSLSLKSSKHSIVEIEGEFQSELNISFLATDNLYLNDSITKFLDGQSMRINGYSNFEYLKARTVLFDNSHIEEFINLQGCNISYLSLNGVTSNGSLRIDEEASIDFLDLRGCKVEHLDLSTSNIRSYLIDEHSRAKAVVVTNACPNAYKIQQKLDSYHLL